MKSNRDQIADAVDRLSLKLLRLHPDNLAISEYNRMYLEKYLADFSFYMSLYTQLLQKALPKLHQPVSESTFVDYGGGCGILSFLAKELGFKTIIYTDIYDVSVRDAQVISDELNLEIGHFWCGDIGDVVNKINLQHIRPDLICSVDVLEHIYNLSGWFASLALIQGDFSLLFMTSANSANPYVARRIKKMQRIAEYDGVEKTSGWKERDTHASFLSVRAELIRNKFPELELREVKQLAAQTRGLRKDDILEAVNEYLQTGRISFGVDHPTNTCDPMTGNWVENLIDTEQLKKTIERNHLSVNITNSEYAYSRNKKLNLIKGILNFLIRCSDSKSLLLSPTYTLEVQRP